MWFNVGFCPFSPVWPSGARRPRSAGMCPQSDSNRHCADFKSAASANWAMGPAPQAAPEFTTGGIGTGVGRRDEARRLAIRQLRRSARLPVQGLRLNPRLGVRRYCPSRSAPARAPGRAPAAGTGAARRPHRSLRRSRRRRAEGPIAHSARPTSRSARLTWVTRTSYRRRIQAISPIARLSVNAPTTSPGSSRQCSPTRSSSLCANTSDAKSLTSSAVASISTCCRARVCAASLETCRLERTTTAPQVDVDGSSNRLPASIARVNDEAPGLSPSHHRLGELTVGRDVDCDPVAFNPVPFGGESKQGGGETDSGSLEAVAILRAAAQDDIFPSTNATALAIGPAA